jgi:DNA-binding IclR family transcriptional regulator
MVMQDSALDRPHHPRGTRHADSVFTVVAAFAALDGPIHGTGELAKAAHLDDSVVSRILRSGVDRGTFLDAGHGKYRLGDKAAQLGIQALAHTAPGAGVQAHDVLTALRVATEMGLVFLYSLAPFMGAGRQCLDMAVGSSDLDELGMTARDVLSVTRSLRTGASGRTILAYLSSAIQQQVLHEPIPAEAGPGVIRDKDVLLASLAKIRENGYARGYQECMNGWNSIAAPFFHGGMIHGCALVLKPATKMPYAPDHMVEATVHAAHQLSHLANAFETGSV